jgi:hypothetical protein
LLTSQFSLGAFGACYPGWNIFQRQWFQKRQVDPDTWKEELGLCSTAWSRLSARDKEKFEAEAAHEQGLREEAAMQPFQSKSDKSKGWRKLGNASFDAASAIPRSGLRAVSRARLQATYKGFCEDDVWSTWNGGISSAEGCLKLDLIDLNSTDLDISASWSKVFKDPVDGSRLWQSESVEGCKHDVCQALHGVCSKMPHVKLASNFVLTMHRLISDGFLESSSSY